MKIEKIDLYPVSVPYKLIERSSRIYRSGVSDIIIKITTDNGIVGWGEATRTASAKVIFETLESMKPILLNSNPWQNLENENNIYYICFNQQYFILSRVSDEGLSDICNCKSFKIRFN